MALFPLGQQRPRSWFRRHVLCPLGLHNWRPDPDLGSRCSWCGRSGYEA